MASNRIIGARNMGNVLGNVARVDRMQRRMAQMTLFELDDAVRVLSGVSNLNAAQANRVRTARTRIETVVNASHQGTSAAAFNTRMTNLATPSTTWIWRTPRSREHHLQHRQRRRGWTARIRRPTAQPGNAPCFNPALRNRPN